MKLKRLRIYTRRVEYLRFNLVFILSIMARGLSNGFLLILVTCSFFLLIIDEIHGKSLHEFDRREKSLVARRYPNLWSFLRRDLDSLSDEVSKSSTRSVIPPRICYLARIIGSTGQQKICLPYNDR